MQKVVIRFALLISLLLLATAPVAAENALAPLAQDTITDTQTLTETETMTEAIPVEVQTTETTTDTAAASENASPEDAVEAEAAPAEAAPAVVAAPVTGASTPPQFQYGLWLLIALVVFGVGFWLQRRGASTSK